MSDITTVDIYIGILCYTISVSVLILSIASTLIASLIYHCNLVVFHHLAWQNTV